MIKSVGEVQGILEPARFLTFRYCHHNFNEDFIIKRFVEKILVRREDYVTCPFCKHCYNFLPFLKGVTFRTEAFELFCSNVFQADVDKKDKE